MTDIAELVNSIPAKRWFLAKRRLDMSTEEILGDPLATLILAANEQEGAKSGNYDNFVKLLDYSLEALSTELGLSADDADKSDEPE